MAFQMKVNDKISTLNRILVATDFNYWIPDTFFLEFKIVNILSQFEVQICTLNRIWNETKSLF